MGLDASALSELLSRALAGDAEGVRQLVAGLMPIVQARVVRGLWRRQKQTGGRRDLNQEVDDLVQDVFTALFADGAKALRAWDPARGLSLANFVGLIAEHEVSARLRNGRRSPWTEEPTLDEKLVDAAGTADAVDLRVISRDLLLALLERLRAELTPRGLRLFDALIMEECPVEKLCVELEMTTDAIYAWRSRFLRLARRTLSELQAVPPSAPRGALERVEEAGR